MTTYRMRLYVKMETSVPSRTICARVCVYVCACVLGEGGGARGEGEVGDVTTP